MPLPLPSPATSPPASHIRRTRDAVPRACPTHTVVERRNFKGTCGAQEDVGAGTSPALHQRAHAPELKQREVVCATPPPCPRRRAGGRGRGDVAALHQVQAHGVTRTQAQGLTFEAPARSARRAPAGAPRAPHHARRRRPARCGVLVPGVMVAFDDAHAHGHDLVRGKAYPPRRRPHISARAQRTYDLGLGLFDTHADPADHHLARARDEAMSGQSPRIHAVRRSHSGSVIGELSADRERWNNAPESSGRIEF
ncbi:hypothetical protein GGX14DRAFT_611161 [Mycena pura]|uniref:Uncharacterized protein n=1 Tax=Mycena pura TaxID=153505 RepID=A0AAD6VN82_9AGAR|nr:hypothetical protein GGX14DRAFT_611161 [Mycena pura]